MQRKTKRLHASFFLCFSLFFFSALAGCGQRQAGDGGVFSVAVSIAPQAYLVERIGLPFVKTTTLVQAGESPATYQPPDGQVSEVMKSRVYFRIGVPFENGKWLEAIASSGKEIRIVDLREGVPMRLFPGGGHAHDQGENGGHSELDPHIWLSPENLKIMAKTILRTFCELDPARGETYKANAAALAKELDKTHESLKLLLEPFRGKPVYVYHPSWGYFCDAYGLKQVAIEIEGKEPSDQELTQLLKTAKEEKIKVIFVQPQIAGNSAKAVARAVHCEIRELDPLVKDVPANLIAVAQTIVESFQ